jgi:hypothetical protein
MSLRPEKLENRNMTLPKAIFATFVEHRNLFSFPPGGIKSAARLSRPGQNARNAGSAAQ